MLSTVNTSSPVLANSRSMARLAPANVPAPAPAWGRPLPSMASPFSLTQGLRNTNALGANRRQPLHVVMAHPGAGRFGDGFAGRMAQETHADHQALSHNPAIAVLQGPEPRQLYVQVLSDKAAFYNAFEQLLPQHADNPVVAALLAVPHLQRSARIQHDLQALGGGKKPTAAAQEYVAHLHELAATNPDLFAIHAWINYLAEMFGGQGLRKSIGEHLGANTVTGFEFDEPLESLLPTTLFCLDKTVPAADEAAYIAEVRQVYAWSCKMFTAALALS